MPDSTDWTLLGKVLTGEATPAERQQLDDWLATHPEQQPVVDSLRQFWLTPNTRTDAPDPTVAQAFARLQQRIHNQPTPVQAPVRPLGAWRPWAGWAAAASVALLVGFLGWQQWHPATDAQPVVEQINPKGTRSQIHLADGSTVWLNADSHLTYPKTFTGALREVSLEGEAFFTVTPNPNQPFVVRLKTGSVRVLGTSFNIRAYAGDSTVETAVVTGRVAFIPKRKADSPRPTNQAQPASATSDTLFLLPNRQAVQSLTRQSVVARPTVAANQIAWTESKLVFRNTPMGEVAKTLERWYGTPVALEGESLRQCPLTGTFQNQSLREVMNLITMTNRFQYELTASQVIIRGTGCAGR